ncbi:MAG: 50S ribosomal protein L11 methyltransferase [Bacteroidota bacterium]
MYLVFRLRYNPEKTNTEELIAWLSAGGFDSFEEIGRQDLWKEGVQAGLGRSEQEIPAELLASFTQGTSSNQGLDAYLPVAAESEALDLLTRLRERYEFEYTYDTLAEQNWNAVWEANFEPILIDNWLNIRAAFHEANPSVDLELLIDPKMAFGTGHHATTYMVCELMRSVDWGAKTVFDFGCGTGILAILAKKMGAAYTWAIDIEEASFQNTLENASINGVSLDRVSHGTLHEIYSEQLVDTQSVSFSEKDQDSVEPERSQERSIAAMFRPAHTGPYRAEVQFHYILANINRNVILASLSTLYERLLPHGKLFVSGILAQDAALVLKAAAEAGFTTVQERQKEDWMAWVFQRAAPSD